MKCSGDINISILSREHQLHCQVGGKKNALVKSEIINNNKSINLTNIFGSKVKSDHLNKNLLFCIDEPQNKETLIISTSRVNHV